MAIDAGSVVAAARSWIGTPYVHQASVRGVGCDCLGLLRGVWREIVGNEPEPLPPYSSDWGETSDGEPLRAGLSRVLQEKPIARMGPGDIALFRMVSRGPAKHCGIVAERLGVTTLIHARQNKLVTEEPFSNVWRRKLAFVFGL